MSLVELVDNDLTDKNTVHSYLDLYEQLLKHKKETATNILEIGIGPIPQRNGGSIKLWADYFKNAKVHGIDIIPIDNVLSTLITHPRVFLHTQNDAYNNNFFMNTFYTKEDRFDLILDDGPHTLQSMETCIKLYSNILKNDGILMIEDVQDINWISSLIGATPEHLRCYIEVYDRRNIKGRYDDIVFVINKGKQFTA
jgi:hypothetical protein